MISLNIKDIKSFMSHLLVKNTFDNFLLSEAAISTANTYNISGLINKNFYSSEELSELSDMEYSLWESVKPFCFSLIKGNKVPTGMKIVFLLSKDDTAVFLKNAGDAGENVLQPDEINGLVVNINYSNGAATIITGTSLKIFTLDKTTEHYFDKYIKQFLLDVGIDYEEI